MWLLPFLEICHYLGHTLGVGAIIYLDLRLLGINRHLPVTKMSEQIIPWSVSGLLLAIISGSALFLTDIGLFWGNPALEIKLLLIIAALANVAIFHFGVFRKVKAWDQDKGPPVSARMSGSVSIVFWLAAIISGRLIAYY